MQIQENVRKSRTENEIGIELQIMQISDTKCMFSIEQLGKVPLVRKMHVATNTFVQTHLYDSKSKTDNINWNRTCMTAAIKILGRRPNLSLGKQTNKDELWISKSKHTC